MPYNPQPASPIRVPCPVTNGNPQYLQGLYFGSASVDAEPVKVVTLFPLVESAVAKRFPVFENILGSTTHIHECDVRVRDIYEHKEYRFLIAYQARPHSPLNLALSKLVPGAEVRGEILVMRSGEFVLVQRMGGHFASEAAKLAVRKFVQELKTHKLQNGSKRVTPPLPRQIGL
ncbi:hypothetical protein C8T65DRAFT_586850 [Cerioporus squamosus]|nr:hypothetical protein C8T65DRAFT_711430 [Cerioporus squamosus]KAI0692073.1 hypothetical protein C8T65DRAFT_586850 [Cerioporus squamosus]